MSAPYTEYELNEYLGRTYFLLYRFDGSPKDPNSFAVNIHYKSAEEEDWTVIARVDTAHGFTHFDKLFKENQPKEAVDWGMWEAVNQLSENWLWYAQQYEKNHSE